MSTIGTGIAAAVANTGQTARTLSASQSGQDAQRAGASAQTDKLTITQLHDASATRDADQDMPDQQAPGYEDLYDGDGEPPEDHNPNDEIHDADAPASSPTGISAQPTYGPGYTADHPLFHALDVKA